MDAFLFILALILGMMIELIVERSGMLRWVFGCKHLEKAMANDTTSVAAYTSNTVQDAQQPLADALYASIRDHGPATRAELAQRLSRPVNCITAAVKALLKAGHIVETKQVQNEQTGKKAWLLELPEDTTSKGRGPYRI